MVKKKDSDVKPQDFTRLITLCPSGYGRHAQMKRAFGVNGFFILSFPRKRESSIISLPLSAQRARSGEEVIRES